MPLVTQINNQTLILSYSNSNMQTRGARRPLARLTLTLTLTFDLIFIGGRGNVMDYPCAEFDDFNFSSFGFNVRTDRHTEKITEAGDRYTHATSVITDE